MDPLGGLVGLLGAGLSASHQGLADAIAYMNLQFQKQQAEKANRFAQAGRSDVYGNVQKYNPATNSWEIDLTPTQNQITKAGEKEQLLSLTEDATRNRNIKRTQVARGQQAAKDYNTALAGYRYDQPMDERSIRAELTKLSGNAQVQGMKGQQAASIRQALRANQGGLLPQITKTTDDAIGASLADTLLKARNQSVTEAAGRRAAHDQTYLPEMSQLMQVMDAGGGAPQKFSDLPQTFDAMQGQQAQTILNALKTGASGVGGAFDTLGSAFGKSPDLSKVASLFGGGKTSSLRTTGYNSGGVTTQDDGAGTDIPDTGDSRLDLMTTGNW